MERILEFFDIYTGKIGTANALLMLTGLLFFILFFLKRQEARYDRFWVYFFCGIFFTMFGFLFDIYRIKALRPALLNHWGNFIMWKNLTLFVTLLPLYVALVRDIVAIVTRLADQKRKR